MTPEKRITFLGVIEKGEADEVFFVPDLNAPPEEIAQAIKRANAQREAEKRRELERLRAAMGLLPERKADDAPPKARPIGRDWLLP